MNDSVTAAGTAKPYPELTWVAVGVGWIHSSDGSENENISPAFRATGRDAHGGYAEYMTVPEAYAYRIPEVFSDVEAAPLLNSRSIQRC